MYYAGGLLKKKDESTFSYEFVNDETYVFPFLEKHGAMRIAEKCGGTVVNRAASTCFRRKKRRIYTQRIRS